MKKLLIIAVLSLYAGCVSAHHTLFDNGKSSYSIVLGPDASPSEQFAVRELSEHLHKIGGVHLPVVGPGEAKKGHRIIVGFNSDLQGLLPSETIPDEGDESFTYRNVGGDILIWGGRIRGTMYGVYSFLEKEFGCRWYTTDFIVVPERSQYRFGKLFNHEEPYISVRRVWLTDGDRLLWSARNRNNYMVPPAADGSPWDDVIRLDFNGGHSFAHLVPQRKYWATHPEYYSEIDGKRVGGEYTQLCLSNPDVLKIVIDGVRKMMGDSRYRIVDVSQNDSSPHCSCARCTAMADSLGNHTDLLMWFINQVADAVRDEWPDRYIGTFAYEWSVPAPETVRPRDNVIVRLCTYDNCFVHPLAECPRNREWMANFDKWAGIAPHLYIWHYMACFRQYQSPFPFAWHIADDIKVFKEHHAIGVLEEGEYQGPGGNFQELKAWLIAKLLWNPYQDVEALVNTFMTDYYREAAAEVRAYFDLTQSLAESGVHDGCFSRHFETELYPEQFIREGLELARQADAAVADSVTRRHVNLATLPIWYLHARRHPAESFADGTFERIGSIVSEEGITHLSEWGDDVKMSDLKYLMKRDAGLLKEWE